MFRGEICILIPYVICCCIQFFASKKKRKEQSPHLKSGIVEKGSKTTLEASPSGKGSLDTYLVTSQDDISPAKFLQTARGSSARHDLVKRNLALEISLSSKDELKEAYPSSEGRSETSEAFGEAHRQNFNGSSSMGDVVARGLGKDVSDSVHIVENPELKQFAADFLSLYCR